MANADTIKKFYDLFNRRDLDGALNLCSDKVTVHELALTGPAKGRNAVKQLLQGWVTGFSNAKMIPSNVIDAGDTVVVQAYGEGKNDGQFGPFMATNKQVKVPFVDVVKFDNQGKIMELQSYWDMHDFLVQLGHAAPLQMPEGGEAPRRGAPEARP